MIGTRVLVVEDELLVAEEISDRLASLGLTLTAIATSGDEALKSVEDERPDLVLLDIRLKNEPDGVVVADTIDRRYGIPFVFVTAQADDATLARAQQTRPVGYLLKPFSDRNFRTTIALAVHESRERAAAAARNQDGEERRRLEMEANTDVLTGLWNRRMLNTCIETELRRAASSNAPVGILLIDLDAFKPINDGHGHLAGDAALQEVAQRLRKAIRPYDFIGRYGGDEFVVVLPQADGEVAANVARRIRTEVAASPLLWQSVAIPLACSVGIAIADGPTEASMLLQTADRSLYLAKEGGRNDVGPTLRVDLVK